MCVRKQWRGEAKCGLVRKSQNSGNAPSSFLSRNFRLAFLILIAWRNGESLDEAYVQQVFYRIITSLAGGFVNHRMLSN